jgi:hypothetical protein
MRRAAHRGRRRPRHQKSARGRRSKVGAFASESRWTPAPALTTLTPVNAFNPTVKVKASHTPNIVIVRYFDIAFASCSRKTYEIPAPIYVM